MKTTLLSLPCLLLALFVPVSAASGVQARRPMSPAWAAPLMRTLKAAPARFFEGGLPVYALLGKIEAAGKHSMVLAPLARALEARRHTPETFWELLPQEQREKLLAEAVAEATRQAQEKARRFEEEIDAGRFKADSIGELSFFMNESFSYLEHAATLRLLDRYTTLVQIEPKADNLPLLEAAQRSLQNSIAAVAAWDDGAAEAIAAAAVAAASEPPAPVSAKAEDWTGFRWAWDGMPGDAVRRAAKSGDAARFWKEVDAAFAHMSYAMAADARLRGGRLSAIALADHERQTVRLHEEVMSLWRQRLFDGRERAQRARDRVLARIRDLRRERAEREERALAPYRASLDALQAPETPDVDVPRHAQSALAYYGKRLDSARDAEALREAREAVLKGTREVPPIGKVYERWAEAAEDPSVRAAPLRAYWLNLIIALLAAVLTPIALAFLNQSLWAAGLAFAAGSVVMLVFSVRAALSVRRIAHPGDFRDEAVALARRAQSGSSLK